MIFAYFVYPIISECFPELLVDLNVPRRVQPESHHLGEVAEDDIGSLVQ